MKIHTVLVFLLVLRLAELAKESNDYVKFTKVECSTSGITCKTTFCDVRSVAQNESYLDFGCDLQRPLNKIYFNAVTLHKSFTSRNYRQIMNITVEVCETLEKLTSVSLLAGQVEYMNMTFPGFIHKCPYTTIDIYNATLSNRNITESKKRWQHVLLPNGNYKTIWKFSDDSDKNIAQMTFYHDAQFY